MAGKRAIRSIKSIENKKKKLEKRKVLSYEDIPIDEYAEDEEIPKIKMNKKTKQILLISLGLVLVMIVWLNWNSLQPQNIASWFQNSVLGIGTGDGFPMPIRGTSADEQNFNLMGDDVAYVSDVYVDILNNSAKEIKNSQHSLNNPASECNGDMIISYSRGGKAYQVDSKSKQIQKANTDDEIITASVASNGNYAVVTECMDYLAKLTVYDENNTEIYKYYFSDVYVTDIAMNSDGTQVAVSGIQTNNGDMTTTVYVLDLNNTTPKAKKTINDNMIVNLQYLSNDNIALIGNEKTSVYDYQNDKINDYSYDNKTVMAYTISPDIGIGIALSASPDGRNCEYVQLDTSGEIHTQFNTPYKVTSLSLKGNTIAMLSDGMIQAYNAKGENWSSVDVGSDTKKILLYSSKNAYVLGVSEIKHASL